MKKLNDEELNEVSGGGIEDTLFDAEILYKRGYMSTEYNLGTMLNNWPKAAKEIHDAWAKAGIRCETNFEGPNRYFINGVKMPREVALKQL